MFPSDSLTSKWINQCWWCHLCVFTGLWQSAERPAPLTAKPGECSWNPEGEDQSVSRWQVNGVRGKQAGRTLSVQRLFCVHLCLIYLVESRVFVMISIVLSVSQSGWIKVRLSGQTITFVSQSEELKIFARRSHTAQHHHRRPRSLLCTTPGCKTETRSINVQTGYNLLKKHYYCLS